MNNCPVLSSDKLRQISGNYVQRLADALLRYNLTVDPNKCAGMLFEYDYVNCINRQLAKLSDIDGRPAPKLIYHSANVAVNISEIMFRSDIANHKYIMSNYTTGDEIDAIKYMLDGVIYDEDATMFIQRIREKLMPYGRISDLIQLYATYVEGTNWRFLNLPIDDLYLIDITVNNRYKSISMDSYRVVVSDKSSCLGYPYSASWSKIQFHNFDAITEKRIDELFDGYADTKIEILFDYTKGSDFSKPLRVLQHLNSWFDHRVRVCKTSNYSTVIRSDSCESANVGDCDCVYAADPDIHRDRIFTSDNTTIKIIGNTEMNNFIRRMIMDNHTLIAQDGNLDMSPISVRPFAVYETIPSERSRGDDIDESSYTFDFPGVNDVYEDYALDGFDDIELRLYVNKYMYPYMDYVSEYISDPGHYPYAVYNEDITCKCNSSVKNSMFVRNPHIPHIVYLYARCEAVMKTMQWSKDNNHELKAMYTIRVGENDDGWQIPLPQIGYQVCQANPTDSSSDTSSTTPDNSSNTPLDDHAIAVCVMFLLAVMLAL